MVFRFLPLCLVGALVLGAPRSVSADPFESPADQKESETDLADDVNGGKPIELTPEMIEQFAAQLGIDPKGPRMQKILAAHYNPEGEVALAENVNLDEQPETPQQVIRHIRGKEGIAFPSKDSILLPFTLTEEKVTKSLDNYFATLEKNAERNLKVPTLPNCKTDVTTQTATSYDREDNREQVLLDLLFMRKEDIPLDPKEVFGHRVVMRPYYTDKPNVDSLSAIGVGITCLPTRMRVTRSFVMRDEGKNALKNYDKDPHGAGEYHELMRLKLGIAKEG
ncbi:MAG: hypothetical protein J0M12_07405 [Deltaproteobacteria bacterium]|nr:hypothetical protein [Deltaproteobacteria bacterium]